MKTIQKICFLAYETRPGSTILSKYLTENYNVFVVPECNFIIDILKRYYISHSLEESDKQDLLDLIASNRKFSAWGISENLKEIVNFEDNLLISSLIVKILVLLNHQFSPNSILILKKESYPSVFNQLVKIIRDAKLLYIVRDLRAVYASQKNSIYTKTGQPFSKFGVKTAISWNLHLKRSYFIRDDGSETKFIKYEEFVLAPKTTTKQFGFDPIEITDGIKNHYVVPEKYNQRHANVDKQPNLASINNWRTKINYLEGIIIELFCIKYMKKCGYTMSKSSDFFNSLGFVYLAQTLQFILTNLYKKVSKLPWGENILFLEPEI